MTRKKNEPVTEKICMQWMRQMMLETLQNGWCAPSGWDIAGARVLPTCAKNLGFTEAVEGHHGTKWVETSIFPTDEMASALHEEYIRYRNTSQKAHLKNKTSVEEAPVEENQLALALQATGLTDLMDAIKGGNATIDQETQYNVILVSIKLDNVIKTITAMEESMEKLIEAAEIVRKEWCN